MHDKQCVLRNSQLWTALPGLLDGARLTATPEVKRSIDEYLQTTKPRSSKNASRRYIGAYSIVPD